MQFTALQELPCPAHPSTGKGSPREHRPSPALLSLPAPTSLKGHKEFLAGAGSWAGPGLPQQLLWDVQKGAQVKWLCWEAGAEAVPVYLVPGGVPVVVVLPVGQHPLLNLLVPALGSHLEAKIPLSGLQPPPVTPFPFQVSTVSGSSQL